MIVSKTEKNLNFIESDQIIFQSTGMDYLGRTIILNIYHNGEKMLIAFKRNEHRKEFPIKLSIVFSEPSRGQVVGH